ncbi:MULTISPECIES: carbonic anhydrase [Exiguobacterium]|uniref:beta-class carbonic anhydrase n=1 Tax=Exiguobacterium TaxID=33986 RepID=UPI000877923A|nr:MULTISPECIES: carbonic anhydrase [Exiguobacterium]TCI35049.1 carbonic anhydrase [Exiguobacterium sp. SH4S7]TCI44596.1 carbonic anhydrase [Exiguobacterium sp. SH5S32]TCI51002.1 carbonic anhydrase [Exiguobacterium sp. SH1S4]TCI53261.1 carbonic anhydrase [Exiguobacterium sp. SH1S21]TCI59744.1 carbonic anhydrase [Exiguobacterium sp. SH0S2]
MSVVKDMLAFNERFVTEKQYEQYVSDKFPDKKIVILTCMDTRLTSLLPHALGLKNGDAKIIKNAGAVLSHPFGSVMRSILVALYALGAEEVIVVGHYDCGMAAIDPNAVIGEMERRGIDPQTLQTLKASGMNLEKWLHGFDSVEANVVNSVSLIKNHPLLPPGTDVHGFVIDPGTGRLDVVEA